MPLSAGGFSGACAGVGLEPPRVIPLKVTTLEESFWHLC